MKDDWVRRDPNRTLYDFHGKEIPGPSYPGHVHTHWNVGGPDNTPTICPFCERRDRHGHAMDDGWPRKILGLVEWSPIESKGI